MIMALLFALLLPRVIDSKLCDVKPCLLFKQDEKECSYYLKTGQCKYGISCKFHHPQPAGTSLTASAAQFYQQVQSPTVPLPEQYVGASSSLRVARPPILPGSYVQGAYGPVFLSPGVVQFPGWNHYSVRGMCVCGEKSIFSSF